MSEANLSLTTNAANYTRARVFLFPLFFLSGLLFFSACQFAATPTPPARREVIEAGIAEVFFAEPALVLDKRAEPYRRVKLADDLDVRGADAKTISLLELQSGDVVRVEGTISGRDLIAERITVLQTAERIARAPTPTATVRPPTAATPTLPLTPSPTPFSGTFLIADSGNNRVVEVSAEKKIVWEFPPRAATPPPPLVLPSNIALAPNGRTALVVQTHNHLVLEVDYAARRNIGVFGEAGVAGADAKHLDTPSAAYRLRDGRTIIADARNCRVVILSARKDFVGQIGKTGDCGGARGSLGKLNGIALLPNGNLLVTDAGEPRVSEMDLSGNVVRIVLLPNLAQPSNATLTRGGSVLLASYATPGRIAEIDWNGAIVWEYAPTGSERLDRPSRAIELPNGLIAFTDDYNHRVVAVNREQKIVWQYGATGIAGKGAGFLAVPEGIDFRVR